MYMRIVEMLREIVDVDGDGVLTYAELRSSGESSRPKPTHTHKHPQSSLLFCFPPKPYICLYVCVYMFVFISFENEA
jgi:hypothetical protein